MTDLSGIVYQAIVKHCEDLESRKVYLGNGHHLAQKLAELVKKEFSDRDLCVTTATRASMRADAVDVEPDFDIVKVVKFMSVPPLYTVSIKKHGIEKQYEITCELEEFCNFRKFRTRFMASTDNLTLAFIKQWRWEAMFSRAPLENKAAPGQVAIAETIRTTLEEFLEQKKENPEPGDLKTFPGYDASHYFFSLNAFNARLKDRGVKATLREIAQTLKEEGWKDDRVVVGSKNPRLWIKSIESKQT